jgi:hypothetical protein
VTNCFVKVSFRSHTIMGKLLRSLYVGSKTLYFGIVIVNVGEMMKLRSGEFAMH